MERDAPPEAKAASPLATPPAVTLGALAIAAVVHWMIGQFVPTGAGRALDPSSWSLQTVALAIGLRFVWLGSNRGRRTHVILGAVLSLITLFWMTQTG